MWRLTFCLTVCLWHMEVMGCNNVGGESMMCAAGMKQQRAAVLEGRAGLRAGS